MHNSLCAGFNCIPDYIFLETHLYFLNTFSLSCFDLGFWHSKRSYNGWNEHDPGIVFFSKDFSQYITKGGQNAVLPLNCVSKGKWIVWLWPAQGAPEACVVSHCPTHLWQRNLLFAAICNQIGGLCRYRLKAYFSLRWVKLWFRKKEILAFSLGHCVMV